MRLAKESWFLQWERSLRLDSQESCASHSSHTSASASSLTLSVRPSALLSPGTLTDESLWNEGVGHCADFLLVSAPQFGLGSGLCSSQTWGAFPSRMVEVPKP